VTLALVLVLGLGLVLVLALVLIRVRELGKLCQRPKNAQRRSQAAGF
jgi:hypothetical protein